MNNNIAFLFDLDGVILDTEPQYDLFWKEVAEKYQLGIERFEYIIKGNTVSKIMAKYFSHLPEKERKLILDANHDFDLHMKITPIPGAIEFLSDLKSKNKKIGLVTSSSAEKLKYVFSQLPIEGYFDTIVSSNDVKEGKPNPMCYLLAAENLNIEPESCFVFEDSFNGIKAGNAANMKVIGLSTTHPCESIEGDCVKVISDFSDQKIIGDFINIC